MKNIDIFLTEDGSIGLYNHEVKDIYHSRTGAMTESVEKFIIPSKFVEFASSHNEIRLLDFCYGIGYNTKNALKFAYSANPNIKLTIDALDNDPFVVLLSGILKHKSFSDDINIVILDEILNQRELFKNIDFSFAKEEKYKDFLMPQCLENGFLGLFKDTHINFIEFNSNLHNIYYQNISNRNKKVQERPIYNNFDLNFYIDDARASLFRLNNTYDFIFFDAFTPSLVPSLWSVDLFFALKSMMINHSILVTYSSAVIVRSALLEAGFYIGKISDNKGRSIGTIATLDKSLIDNPLNEYDIGLIKTKAGICYRDKEFKLTNEEILKNYNSEKFLSTRQSSSSYIKEFRSKNDL